MENGDPIGWIFPKQSLGDSHLKKNTEDLSDEDKDLIKRAIKSNGKLHENGEDLVAWEKSCCWLCGLPLIFSKIPIIVFSSLYMGTIMLRII